MKNFIQYILISFSSLNSSKILPTSPPAPLDNAFYIWRIHWNLHWKSKNILYYNWLRFNYLKICVPVNCTGQFQSFHLSAVTIIKVASCWAEVAYACNPNILEAEAVRWRLTFVRKQDLASAKWNKSPKPLLYLPSTSHVTSHPLTRKGRYHPPWGGTYVCVNLTNITHYCLPQLWNRKDVSSQLLLWCHAYLPDAMLPAVMIIDSTTCNREP